MTSMARGPLSFAFPWLLIVFAPPTLLAGWLSRNSEDAATSCSPFSMVLTWWANHRQLLEWMDGWLARNGTTNELQLKNDNLLHGRAFSGQCNLLAQHGVVAQWPSRQTDRTGRMAKVQEDVQRSKGNANCLWNIKHLSNKIYFWKECLCVNMNLCSVLPLPCQDVKDKRNRQGLFANEVVAYWFPYSRNSSVNGSWAFNWKCSLVHLLFS